MFTLVVRKQCFVMWCTCAWYSLSILFVTDQSQSLQTKTSANGYFPETKYIRFDQCSPQQLFGKQTTLFM